MQPCEHKTEAIIMIFFMNCSKLLTGDVYIFASVLPVLWTFW